MPPLASSDPRPRLCVIGAGHIANQHLEGLAVHSPGSDFEIWIYDTNPEAATTLAAKYPGARTLENAETIWNEPAREGDVVLVCTPPKFHHPFALAALRSGRHVLCEKPLTLTSTETRSLLAEARRVGRHLGCCSTRMLTSSAVRNAQDLIQSGKLGRLYRGRWIARWCRGRSGVEHQPRSRWFLSKALSGGGALADWSPYDFAVLHHLLDPVSCRVGCAGTAAPVTSVDPKDCVVDVDFHGWATLQYTLKDGSEVSLHYERGSCHHGEGLTLFELEGMQGAVKCDWLGGENVVWGHDDSGKNVYDPIPGGPLPLKRHYLPLREFLKHLRGEPHLAVVNERAAFNHLVLCAIYESAESDRPVLVEHPTSS